MKELETRLNELIRMGRKPWGNNDVESAMSVYTHSGIIFSDKDGRVLNGDRFCYPREIVSLESGLWQFVCDKQLHKHDQRTDSDWIKNIEDTRDSEKSIAKYLTETDYRYRLLESALVPEEELAQFLVDNIIVGGKKE